MTSPRTGSKGPANASARDPSQPPESCELEGERPGLVEHEVVHRQKVRGAADPDARQVRPARGERVGEELARRSVDGRLHDAPVRERAGDREDSRSRAEGLSGIDAAQHEGRSHCVRDREGRRVLDESDVGCADVGARKRAAQDPEVVVARQVEVAHRVGWLEDQVGACRSDVLEVDRGLRNRRGLEAAGPPNRIAAGRIAASTRVGRRIGFFLRRSASRV